MDGSDNLCLFNYDEHLASIHDSIENTEAISTASSNTVYIGLNDIETEETWVWTDGTSWDYGVTYYQPPWWNDQPNKVDENCTMLDTDAYWHDYPCTALAYSLCNYPQPIQIVNDQLNYERTDIGTVNTTFGTIDILDEIYISFDIKFHSFPKVWSNILHFGNSDSQRIPGIYVKNDYHIQFTFTEPHTWNPSRGLNFPLEINTTYHLTLHRTQTHFNATFNGIIVANNDTPSHQVMMDRHMWLGDGGWHYTATVSNLYVTTSNSHAPNQFNYNCDAANRWELITTNWIVNDSACTLTAPNAGDEVSIAWLGTDDESSLNWTDYKVQVKFTAHGGNHVGILIRAQTISAINDQGLQYWFGMHHDSGDIAMGKFSGGFYTYLTHIPVSGLTYGTEYTMRVEVTGTTFNVYWENEFAFTWSDSDFDSGSVGLRTWYASATFSSIIITFPTDEAFPILTCPDDSTQIGMYNADVGGCGLEVCEDRYDTNNITECMEKCNKNVDCNSFNFASMSGDKAHFGVTVCTLYSEISPNEMWGSNQIFCRLNWKIGLTLGYPNNEWLGTQLNIGENTFNTLFQNSYHHIIRRECHQCGMDHQIIYYKRKTNPITFQPYNYMREWISTGNLLDTDFILTSTLQDAIDGTNTWSDCNYDDTQVGAFRDCGPNGLIDDQWTADVVTTTLPDITVVNQARFSVYIYEPLPTPSPTLAPTYEPTLTPTSANPTTSIPSINPTSAIPTTSNPTSANPTTSNPTTSNPTYMPSINPTTSDPTTNVPTTYVPSSNPTTSIPTTSNPTTNIPSQIPITANPTTMNPITSTPITNTPTIFITTSTSDHKTTNNEHEVPETTAITSTHMVSTNDNQSKESINDPKFNDYLIYIVIGTVSAITCVNCCLLIWCLRKKRKKKMHKDTLDMERVGSVSMADLVTTTNPDPVQTDTPQTPASPHSPDMLLHKVVTSGNLIPPFDLQSNPQQMLHTMDVSQAILFSKPLPNDDVEENDESDDDDDLFYDKGMNVTSPGNNP